MFGHNNVDDDEFVINDECEVDRSCNDNGNEVGKVDGMGFLRMVLMTSLVMVIVRMTEMLFVCMFGDYVDTILLMMRMVMMWTMAII